MKKILIVDDNRNNRMLLRAVIEEYAQDEKTIKILIDEASNGVEALEMNRKNGYELIFMDIMMPEMDGIEATKQIRLRDKKPIIVAVSAVDDAERQREILENGAEDYISKPINVDIFQARLSNYLALIESRRHARHPRQAHNPFSRDIYARKMLFGIESEDDLAEFWEYYLLNTRLSCALLSDTVRTLYAIGSIALKLAFRPVIIVEESEGYLYFTMERIEELDEKFIRLVLAKNPVVTDYQITDEKFSIRFIMEGCTMPNDTVFAPVAAEPVAAAEPEPIRFAQTDTSENQVYTYMDPDDFADLQGYLARLNSLLLVVGSGDIHQEEVEEIAVFLDRIGKVAVTYTESYAIGRSLMALAEDIRGHIEGFIEKSSALGPMCTAFSRDLMSWIRLIFEEGAPSVNYMDDTITANAQMIGGMLKMDEVQEDAGDLDDIFDF